MSIKIRMAFQGPGPESTERRIKHVIPRGSPLLVLTCPGVTSPDRHLIQPRELSREGDLPDTGRVFAKGVWAKG